MCQSNIKCNYMYEVLLIVVVQSTGSLKMYQLQHHLGANFHGINIYPYKIHSRLSIVNQ